MINKDFKGHKVGWEGKESEPGEFGKQENMMKTHIKLRRANKNKCKK